MWLLLALSIALAGAPSQAAIDAESGWTEYAVEDRGGFGGIRSRHKVLGGVDCLEASAVTTLPVATMKAVILDIPGNLRWSSAGLARSDVLSTAGGNIDYVQVIDLPSPLADRYWFLRGRAAQQGSSWIFSWERLSGAQSYPQAQADVLAKHAGAVEVGVNVGSWALIPAEGGTLARFRSCTDSGGNIPRWAGEAAAKRMIPNNIVDLFKETRRRSGG